MNAYSGFFIPGFPKLLRFQNHHDRILKKCLKRLKKHMVGSFKGHRQRISTVGYKTIFRTITIEETFYHLHSLQTKTIFQEKSSICEIYCRSKFCFSYVSYQNMTLKMKTLHSEFVLDTLVSFLVFMK